MPLVTSGVEHGNLRELALARMNDLGTHCRDVRTREVGIQEIHHKVRPYEASHVTCNHTHQCTCSRGGPTTVHLSDMLYIDHVTNYLFPEVHSCSKAFITSICL